MNLNSIYYECRLKNLYQSSLILQIWSNYYIKEIPGF
jgi:hypothetical protein